MVLSSNQNKSQNCLLSLFSERDIKTKKKTYGVTMRWVEEKVIQGTLRTETKQKAVLVFPISYTNRGCGIHSIIETLRNSPDLFFANSFNVNINIPPPAF